MFGTYPITGGEMGDRFRFMTFISRTGYFVQASLPDGTTVDQSDPTFLELVVTQIV